MPREGKKQLKVWLDLADYEAVKTHAESAGLTVTDYIRIRCAKAPAHRKRRRPDAKALHLAAGQLGKIGSNLNQLARIAHQSGRLPQVAALEQIRERVFATTDQIADTLGYGSKG